MTQDEIIEMARQAGFFINDELTITSPFIEDICISSMLKEFAKLVADKTVRESSAEYRLGWNDGQIHEREECAKLCDSTVEQTYISGYTGAVHSGRRECAEAIRARNID
jgi:hypothetical protein